MTTSAALRSTSRREFIRAGCGVAALGLASRLPLPAVVSAAGENERIEIGLIGCGGRGTGAAAQTLQAGDDVELAAMGDLFAERQERSLATPGMTKFI